MAPQLGVRLWDWGAGVAAGDGSGGADRLRRWGGTYALRVGRWLEAEAEAAVELGVGTKEEAEVGPRELELELESGWAEAGVGGSVAGAEFSALATRSAHDCRIIRWEI